MYIYSLSLTSIKNEYIISYISYNEIYIYIKEKRGRTFCITRFISQCNSKQPIIKRFSTISIWKKRLYTNIFRILCFKNISFFKWTDYKKKKSHINMYMNYFEKKSIINLHLMRWCVISKNIYYKFTFNIMHSWYDCWWVDTRHHLLYGQWGNESGVLTPWKGLLLSWQINTGHLRYPVTYLFPGIIIQIFGTFVMERSPVLANVVFWAVMDVHIVTVSSSVATEIPCNTAKSYTIFYNLLHIRYFSRGGGSEG